MGLGSDDDTGPARERGINGGEDRDPRTVKPPSQFQRIGEVGELGPATPVEPAKKPQLRAKSPCCEWET